MCVRNWHLANINAAGATKEIYVIISLCQFVKWSGLCSLCKKTSYPSCVDFQARHGYTIDPYRYKIADAPSAALKVRHFI